MFILLLGLSASADAQIKVGYTNVELIMAYMPEVSTVQKQVESYERDKQKEIDDKKNQFTALYTEYQEKSKDPSFKDSQEGKALMDSVQKLQKEIAEKEENHSFDVNQKRSVLLQPIMNKLQKAIDEVAEENGYTYILNQTSGTNILYGIEQYDVTKAIAKKMGVSIPE